jgi:ABC-2 type transport system ATP-binding protein
VIIADGRIIAQGTPQELVGGHAQTRVRSADDRALRRALRSHSIEVTTTDDGALLADATAEAVSDVSLAAGVAVRDLRATGNDLEQLFFRLTENGTREPHDIDAPARPAVTTDTTLEEVNP